MPQPVSNPVHASMEALASQIGAEKSPAEDYILGGEDAPDVAALRRRAALDLEGGKVSRRAPTSTAQKEQDTDGLSRLAMESDLRGAIARGEIVPFFQPVVRLSTGAISACMKRNG